MFAVESVKTRERLLQSGKRCEKCLLPRPCKHHEKDVLKAKGEYDSEEEREREERRKACSPKGALKRKSFPVKGSPPSEAAMKNSPKNGKRQSGMATYRTIL